MSTARLLRPTTILSLCDFTGVWSRPYEDDDYDVIRVDLEHGQDVRLLKLPSRPIHGILAAPPCTYLANSGARWERAVERTGLCERWEYNDNHRWRKYWRRNGSLPRALR